MNDDLGISLRIEKLSRIEIPWRNFDAFLHTRILTRVQDELGLNWRGVDKE